MWHNILYISSISDERGKVPIKKQNKKQRKQIYPLHWEIYLYRYRPCLLGLCDYHGVCLCLLTLIIFIQTGIINLIVMMTLNYCWTMLIMWTPTNRSIMMSLTLNSFRGLQVRTSQIIKDDAAKLKLGLDQQTHILVCFLFCVCFHLSGHWKRL